MAVSTESELPLETTAAQVGIKANQQVLIALQTMRDGGGKATIDEIYRAVNLRMSPAKLSGAGRATLRSYINRDAVRAGLVLAYNKEAPGWHITAAGQEFLLEHSVYSVPLAEEGLEEVTAASGAEVSVPHIVVQAAAFERYMLDFMKILYPAYSWYHQGRHKGHERGLDLIGTRLRKATGRARLIGVQVKLHQSDNAPSDKEWLKFLAGCFVRKVDEAVL